MMRCPPCCAVRGISDKPQRLVCYDTAVVRVPGALNSRRAAFATVASAVPPPAAPVARRQHSSSFMDKLFGPDGPKRAPQTTVAAVRQRKHRQWRARGLSDPHGRRHHRPDQRAAGQLPVRWTAISSPPWTMARCGARPPTASRCSIWRGRAQLHGRHRRGGGGSYAMKLTASRAKFRCGASASCILLAKGLVDGFGFRV